MLEVLILIVLAQGVVFAALCGWLAGQKHRDVLNWIVLGFLFGLIALLVLGFAPSREHRHDGDADRPDKSQTRALLPGALTLSAVMLLDPIIFLWNVNVWLDLWHHPIVRGFLLLVPTALLVFGFARARELHHDGDAGHQVNRRKGALILGALALSIGVALSKILWLILISLPHVREIPQLLWDVMDIAGAMLVAGCFLGLFVDRVPARIFRFGALAVYLIPALLSVLHLFLAGFDYGSSFAGILVEMLISMIPAILLAVLTLRKDRL